MLFTVAPVPLSAEKRYTIYYCISEHQCHYQLKKDTQFTTASVLFTATTVHFSSAAGGATNRKSKIYL